MRVVLWLVGVNAGVFVLQNILLHTGAGRFMGEYFAFRSDSIYRGFIWTPLTYSFLHSTGNFFHILGNLLGLFFLGRSCVQILGTSRFLKLYLGSALAGGVLWFLASFFSNSPSVIGASGAVFGLLAFVCFYYWDREIELLLFFALPAKIKTNYIIYLLGGIAVLGFLFQEIAGGGPSVAHSAHLGGLIFGYAFHRYVYLKNPYAEDKGFALPLKGFFKRSKKARSAQGYNYKVYTSSEPRNLKKEVDRILDKINTKGFGSLSANEKRILDEARDLLRRR